MARGSPDWTKVVHNHHIHYLNKTTVFNWASITTLTNWTEVLNVDMEGQFGWLWWAGDDPNIYVRITVDGDVLFNLTIEQIMNLGAFGTQNSWGKLGVLRYDAINNYYYAFFDAMWNMYIHSNLTIEITYELGSSGNGACRVHYKQVKT